ncbi:MAG: YggS family pyridoxal phosphate-dependent enzyme [Candidatus Omnitrophota bacterium]|nr:MAG: YggS family pyridoxal phosphate-dependent enzyme [Candidatus Omnitrophota bacterium]
MNIADNIRYIKEKTFQCAMRCGRNPEDIKIIAVSKTKPVADITTAMNAGLKIFGENKVQEAEQKIFELKNHEIEWHLIGHLQTNKVKKAISMFQLIHSVDSPKLIHELEKQAEKCSQDIHIMLQVNVSGETTKSGVDLNDFEELLAALKQTHYLRCHGLMTIPPLSEESEESRPIFRALRKLGEQYKDDIIDANAKLELSMGMTHDFTVAIEEGATMVRIGTAIFGNRRYG